MEHDGRITGYATVIGFFGHAVGETNKDLKALISAAKEFAGPGFLLPTRNGELFRWCLNNGLRIAQPMTLMSKGLYDKPPARFCRQSCPNSPSEIRDRDALAYHLFRGSLNEQIAKGPDVRYLTRAAAPRLASTGPFGLELFEVDPFGGNTRMIAIIPPSSWSRMWQ